jgi:hypothetical protein
MKTTLACPVKIVTTYKAHVCYACNDAIAKGEKCIAFSVKNWRETLYHHAHSRCVPEINWREL